MTRFIIPFLFLLLSHAGLAANNADTDMHWLSVQTKDKKARTALQSQGMSIESVVEDMSYGYAPLSIIQQMEKNGVKVITHFSVDEISHLDFPNEDAPYHNYTELTDAIQKLTEDYPNIVHAKSIGKTTLGKEMWGIRISSSAKNFDEPTALPGIVFMGGHHAREHLSMELPLMYAQHIASSYGKNKIITDLVNRRDIYFIPMVNVDGSEFDIDEGKYRMWRKNRRENENSNCDGVDLNRNYGYGWNTGGSSSSPCSDVYMGASAFSEIETRNIKTFVESRPNLKVLLTFHTFSELILYPWGNTYDPIANVADRNAYTAMARTMAGWNGYTAEQSSELYITSGDTTDWSYGALGIFSFTFELEPKDMWSGGGFYPGTAAIQHAFDANLRPVLYLIDLADNPRRAAVNPETTLFYGR